MCILYPQGPAEGLPWRLPTGRPYAWTFHTQGTASNYTWPVTHFIHAQCKSPIPPLSFLGKPHMIPQPTGAPGFGTAARSSSSWTGAARLWFTFGCCTAKSPSETPSRTVCIRLLSSPVSRMPLGGAKPPCALWRVKITAVSRSQLQECQV